MMKPRVPGTASSTGALTARCPRGHSECANDDVRHVSRSSEPSQSGVDGLFGSGAGLPLEADFLAPQPLSAALLSETVFRDAAALFLIGPLLAGVLTLRAFLVGDFLPTGILRPAVPLLDTASLLTGVLRAGAFLAVVFLAGWLLTAFLAFGFRATVLSAPAVLPVGDVRAAFLPEDFDVEGRDGVRRRLVTTVRSPGPGMRLVSPPVSQRTVSMAPLTAVTTPVRGVPVVATSIRVPTSATSISSLVTQ